MSKIEDLKRVGENVLGVAAQKGADEAEAYFVSNRVLTVRLVNNAVFEAKGVHDIGVGVRVLKENGLGFSSTAELSPDAVEKVVTAAIEASEVRKLPFKYSFPQPAQPQKVEGVFDQKLAQLPPEDAVDLAYNMVEESKTYDAKIEDNAGVLNLVEYYTVIVNSHGLSASNKGTFFEASLNATAKEAGTASEGSEAKAGRNLDEFKPVEIGRSAAEMAVSGLKSKGIKEGFYTIILDPEPAADVATSISMLVSPLVAKLYYPLFLDKMETQVGSSILTMIDDPIMPGGVRSTPVDDEGTPSKKTVIMENGVLKAFVYDTFYGAIEKKETTGNAQRESFAVGVSSFPGKNYNGEPIPLPLNPYVQPGGWKRDEIIKDTMDGLLVRRFHYSRMTNPTRGDFTSVLRMGLYHVKNGEVIGAVKKSRLLDNLLDMLKNVDAVSDTLVVGGSWGNYLHTPVIRTKAHVTPVE